MNKDKAIKNVDPFIGVDGGGNCLCGPYLPLGMVRPGPDMMIPHPTNGYKSSSPIIRFSNTHVSGTGGGGRYGNIGVLPFTGKPSSRPSHYKLAKETATTGYYRSTLLPSGITVELTATFRVAIHRYTYPDKEIAHVLIDAGSVIQRWADPKSLGSLTGTSIGGFLEFSSDKEIQGRADFRGGWGHTFPYSIYFYILFDQPFNERIMENVGGTHPGTALDGPDCKAIVGFGKCKQVILQIGISFVSIGKARASVEREVGPKGFETIRSQAMDIWEQTLSSICVLGGTSDQLALFYTFFTRLLCMPTDLGVDDENAFWISGKRSFTDIYCLWDSVRNANSLIGLFDAQLEVDMLNNLIDIAEHTGWLPDFWFAGHSGYVQGGSSADIIISEAAAKGLKPIDFRKALKLMRKNNEIAPPDPHLCGRYLDEYLERGYLSANVKNCVSRSIEYSYQDWCIGNLAEHLGDKETAERFYRSSARIWELWRNDLKCFAPRKPDGTWVEPFDPIRPTRKDDWNDPYFYEGTAHEWTLCVLHDLKGLIDRHGGPDAFVAHLDRFFDEYLYHWKEIILHTPYLYHYAGRPDRTVEVTRKILSEKYKRARSGLPDNEDMGSHSAFYMCSAIGLYPIMGQDIYLLSTPLFREVKLRLKKTGNTLLIRTSKSPKEHHYINEVQLNGRSLKRNWVKHSELISGGILDLVVEDTPNGWGTVEIPPSPLSEIRERLTNQ